MNIEDNEYLTPSMIKEMLKKSFEEGRNEGLNLKSDTIQYIKGYEDAWREFLELIKQAKALVPKESQTEAVLDVMMQEILK